MIVLESGDKLRGDATNASEVDFTVHGLDNNALKQMADGQLPSSIGDLYTADSTDVVTAVILVNTGAAHNHVNLYLTPSGGTARRLIAKDLQLEAGYALYFEGGKAHVLSAGGALVETVATDTFIDDTATGTNGVTDKAISTNAFYDHQAATAVHGINGAVVGTSDTQELDNKTLDSSVGKGTWTVSGTWTLPAVTLGGDVQLGEVSLLLDEALSAEGKWSGIAEAGVAGATLAFGDLVYQAVADGRWELAKADATATSIMKLGICILAATSDGDPTTVLLWGKVNAATAFPDMTAYAPVYISAATAGDVTSTAPSTSTNVVRIVGHANSGDELFFNPDPTWVVIA